MIKVDFPALKEWKITADQHSNSWIFPQDSKVTLKFHNFDVDFNVDLDITKDGYIEPVVYAIDIKFGDSTFTTEDQFVSFWVH